MARKREIPVYLRTSIRAWMKAEALSDEEALGALGRVVRADIVGARVLMSMQDQALTMFPPVMFADKVGGAGSTSQEGEGVALTDEERQVVVDCGLDPSSVLRRERERAAGGAA